MVAGSQRLWRHGISAGALVAIATALLWTSVAQGSQPDGDSRVRETPVTAQRLAPDPAGTLRLFNTLDSWVRDGIVPETPGTPDPAWGHVHGVQVVVTLSGAVLGRAQSLGSPEAGLVKDAHAGWRLGAEAARAALLQLGSHPMVLALADNASRRALRQQATISVEFAGALTPIVADEYAQASQDIDPGLDGVAARMDGRVAALFPVAQLLLGIPHERTLGAVASQAGNDATLALETPGDLRRTRGVEFFRFAVEHAVRHGAAGTTPPGPEFLHRASRVIDRGALSVAALRQAGDGLARHLSWRLSRGTTTNGSQPEAAGAASQAVGVYDPIRDQGEPGSDPVLDDALARIALLSYAEAIGDALASENVVSGALTVTQEPSTPLARSARFVLIALAARSQALSPELRANCATALHELRPGVLGLFDTVRGFDPDFPSAARGLVAYALALDPVVDSSGVPERGASAVRRVFVETPPGDLVAQMPWLGFAELALRDAARLAARAGPTLDEPMTDREPTIPSAPALRTMRERVWAHQVALPPPGSRDVDLVGGIVFTRGGRALPGAQSARPLAFIAAMLSEPALTGEQERAVELGRLLTSLRFLRQLQTDDAFLWLCPDPTRPAWGVRASAWEWRMPIEASTLTLMTYARTLGSLSANAAR